MPSPSFDSGPSAAVATICAQRPVPSTPKAFWTAWGPIFYRGRLDGSARLLCIASDPGPTERIAHRTLVGDAGQRVQGFLRKLGLTTSYLLVNAFPYALHPSYGQQVDSLLAAHDKQLWRHQFYDTIRPPNVQAVVAFGVNAHKAFDLWPSKPNVQPEKVLHPSSHDAAALLGSWHDAIARLRPIFTPDPDGSTNEPNYGSSSRESDYAPIPRRDLPFGVPAVRGDDSGGRNGHPKHNDPVSRPTPDDGHTLIRTAPK